jgi:endonuclease/exonuclease/phosphatase family metal-dependent hydrolase
MKLISLNIWGGHVRGPLLEFIKAHRDIDIFCFQEVYHEASKKISTDDRAVSLNIFTELQALLPDHIAFFKPVVGGFYGIGSFVKKGIHVLNEGEVSIYDNPNYPGHGPTHSRNLQWIECQANGQTFSVVNIHGLWNGQGKTDSSERIVQSERIKKFINNIKCPTILCGDFNLRPDTESIRILEKGMNNLVKLYNITSTRTSFYPKEEKFADYVLTSPDINVEHFEILHHEVSDHLPLFLEFK